MKFSYEPVTQKFVANVKSETTFTLYGDLPDILGFGAGTGDSSSTCLASSTARQVGGALPYFTGARVQRGHGFGSLFSGLLRTVAPLIRRGAVALGKRALTTGAQIAGDVVAGKNVKKAAKRRATVAGRNLMQILLNTPPPPGKRLKRIKRAAPRRRVIPIKRRQRTDVFS